MYLMAVGFSEIVLCSLKSSMDGSSIEALMEVQADMHLQQDMAHFRYIASKVSNVTRSDPGYPDPSRKHMSSITLIIQKSIISRTYQMSCIPPYF